LAAVHVGKVWAHDDQSVTHRSSNPDHPRDLVKKSTFTIADGSPEMQKSVDVTAGIVREDVVHGRSEVLDLMPHPSQWPVLHHVLCAIFFGISLIYGSFRIALP
jgi:hypothetical protein